MSLSHPHPPVAGQCLREDGSCTCAPQAPPRAIHMLQGQKRKRTRAGRGADVGGAVSPTARLELFSIFLYIS
eukprot:gene11106-biopygen9391